MTSKSKTPFAQQKKIYEMRESGSSWDEITSAMKISMGKCRWSYRRNKKLIRQAGVSVEEYFGVSDNDNSKQPVDLTPVLPDGKTDTNDDSSERWLFTDDYVYNEDADVYITFVPGIPRPVTVSGDIHRALLVAYSDWDGVPATINEICREFGMPRQLFERYKKVHGWTHDMEPFVKEEVDKRDIDEMVEEAHQMKRRALHQKYEKQKWRLIKADADKWNRLDYGTLTPLIAAIEQNAPNYTPEKVRFSDKEAGRKVAAFVSIFCDLHFGKYAWGNESGASYNREIAKERVLDAARKTIDMMGCVDTVIIPVGSDDEHVDNYSGKTTRGTEQDIDGTPAQIAIEYGELLITVIDMFRQVSEKVIIPVVHGNHNRHTAVMRGVFVDAWYRNCEDVDVISKSQPRNYIQYGVNLIGFTHGDSEKQATLPGLMAKEQPRMWADTTHRTWIVNHFHQEKLSNMLDVRVFTVPALSGPDRWHFRKGYVSDPAAAVYLFDYVKGISGTLLVNPDY